MDFRKGNVTGYLKFFFQCIIDQCNSFISKIKRVKEIYIEDMKIAQKINSGYAYKIMQILMTQIVFTKKEVEELSCASKVTVLRIIDSLVQLGIIVPDSTANKK